MKKIIFSTLFAALGLSAAAQTGAGNTNNTVANASVTSSRVSTNEEIRVLANRLELNEYGYIRLRDLSKARNEQIAEINNMYSNDPAMRQSKLNDVNKAFESGLAQAITSKQFTAYQQLMGRTPGATGAGFEAGGYGGRSLEGGSTNTPTGTTPPNVTTPATTNTPANGSTNMKVDDNKVKLEDGTNSMKVKTRKEKVETKDAEYKSDADEIKMKSKDGKVKAKSEPGKTKIETPEGKLKIEDGEMKVKPKNGQKVKTAL